MSKEFTYFKFMIPKWLLGRINKEADTIKGIFVDACAIYWLKQCNLEPDRLMKELGRKRYNKIIASGYVEDTEAGIMIPFLDEQYDDLMGLSDTRSRTTKEVRAKKSGKEYSDEKPDGPFFRLSDKVIPSVPSDHFRRNFKSFYQVWEGKHSKEIGDLVLQRMDNEYLGYKFTDENHMQRTFLRLCKDPVSLPVKAKGPKKLGT